MANEQPITTTTSTTDTTSTTTTTTTTVIIVEEEEEVEVEVGQTYAFSIAEGSNDYWMLSNFILWQGASGVGVANDTNFQFHITEGLAENGTISFESVNYPGRYLRHSECDIWLNMGSGSIFRESASFIQRAGLAGAGGISFESYDKPGHYLRVSGSRISLDPIDCCEDFNNDATFYPT